MRFIERSPEEVQKIIRDHRANFTVHVTGVRERLNSTKENYGFRSHIAITSAGADKKQEGFDSQWLFATQADAMGWGYWWAATRLEANA